MKTLAARAVAVCQWAKSPMGRKDIGLVIAAADAIYVALHRAGL